MEGPLYDDGKIQIKLAEMPEDHLLGIRPDDREEYSYYHIARSGLRSFALADRGFLESKLDNYNPVIPTKLKQCDLTVKDAHIAFLQAYIEDQERIRIGSEQIRMEMEDRE